MELLLIRHALPLRVEDRDGPADPELAPEGWEQARRLAAWLAQEPIDALYASPLRRAVQTAEPLAEITGLEVRLSEGVAEWDRNANTYIPIEELRATNDPVWQSLAKGALHELGVDAEAFQATVVRAIDDIALAHSGQRVAVVCHGGVLNAYVSAILGLERILFFPPDYTGITRLWSAPPGVRTLRSLNESGHLH